MTEDEWLNSDNLVALLAHLQPLLPPDARKYRLFVSAVGRRRWAVLPPKVRSAVEIGERFADGNATEREVNRAFARAPREPSDLSLPALAAWPPDMQTSLSRYLRLASTALIGFAGPGGTDRLCGLIRELVGNPFRPVASEPSWLTPTVKTLATAVYEERRLPPGLFDNQRLAVLADALEDTGWDSAELLAHLRSGGDHVRGCWAVDLVLGKG